MGNAQRVISFQEFSNHPAEVFESVLDGVEIIVQRAAGESITLTASASSGNQADHEAETQRKIEAILAAAGSWSDVDTDEMLKQLRSSRNIFTRPLLCTTT